MDPVLDPTPDPTSDSTLEPTPDPTLDPTPFFRMQKNFLIFFSYNLPAGTLSAVLNIEFFAKILC